MPEKKKTAVSPKLMPVLDLFVASWDLYKATFLSYLKVFGVGILLVFAGLLLGIILAIPLFISSGGSAQNIFAHPTPQQIAGMIVMAAWFLAYIVVLVIYSLYAPVSYILILTSKKKSSIRELFNESKPFIFPVFIASLLTSVFVLGGVGLFIVPGIVFGILFSFVTNVIVVEKLRGMDALKRSYQLVSSHFWGILLRILLIEIIVSVSSNILDSLANQSKDLSWIKVVSEIYSVVVEWFVVVYTFLLYKQVSSIKVSLPAFRTMWILVAVGFVLLVLFVFYYTVINPLGPHAFM